MPEQRATGVVVGQGREVHAIDPSRRSRTLCGLEMMWASSWEPTTRAVTCGECLRVKGAREEAVA